MNQEAIESTKVRQREALKIIKRIEDRIMSFKTNDETNWGHAGSMGAILDKLKETESIASFL